MFAGRKDPLDERGIEKAHVWALFGLVKVARWGYEVCRAIMYRVRMVTDRLSLCMNTLERIFPHLDRYGSR
jgi:hypothetical protein